MTETATPSRDHERRRAVPGTSRWAGSLLALGLLTGGCSIPDDSLVADSLQVIGVAAGAVAMVVAPCSCETYAYDGRCPHGVR